MILTEGPAAPASPLYSAAPGRPRLRVSVVVSCLRMPAWLDEMLAALAQADFLEVQWLRSAEAPARRQGSLVWRAFQHLDRLLLGELRPIMAERPLRHEMADVTDPLDRARLHAAIASFTPDVLLSIGHSPSAIDLWSLARRAAWSIPAEACLPNWGLMHLLPAFLRGDDRATSGLPMFDDRTGMDLLLDPAEISVAQISFARNTAYQLQKAPAKLLRALRHLHRGEPSSVIAVERRRPPGNTATVALCLRLLFRSALRYLPRLGQRERWTLATRTRGRPLDPAAPSAEGFTLWTPPKGWFWADPFPWLHDGREQVFFEAYDYDRAIGEIHVVNVDDEGQPSPPVPVMRGPHHLSYPFLFQHDGAPHMLVECAGSRRIDAFRAERYPDVWTPVATLLEGWRAVDGTLLQHAGRWWLYACVAETPFDDGGREFTDLFLFHAASPLGPWTPHRENPVVSDVRRARPAGPLFIHEGRLIRPSQDCAAEYGHRIVFNEVTRLEVDHYEEAPIAVLHPDWANGLRGCHTYARCGRLELLDGKRLAPVSETRMPAAGPQDRA